ncbi:MAG: hypothetical protein CVU06_02450 [Bacteroidetes bacterium HGW-Bacteroidetes-22]|nr:MAG: hypothetical protein CVU06_02450 [Bacteroidetes bacterium HGW-Bacteroidetes-22]
MKCLNLRNWLLITSLISFASVYGQWEEYTPSAYRLKDTLNFNLKDYINPEYHYRELEALFHLTGELSGWTTDSYIYLNKTNSFNLSPDISLSANCIHNTLHRQQQTSWQLLGGFNASNQTVDRINYLTTINSFSGGGNLYFNNETRFYNGKRYLGVGMDAYLSYNKGYSKSETSGYTSSFVEERSTSVNLYVEPTITVGWGRIEETSNAWLTVHLLRALQKSGRLAIIPTVRDVKQLADLVTHLRNSRYFDYRFRLIANLTALDSALRASGLTSKADITTFSAINDVWIYSNRPGRLSGNRLYAGISPGIDWSRLDSKITSQFMNQDSSVNNSVEEDNFQHYDFVAGLICEKPLNMEWQQSLSVSARGGLCTTQTTYLYEAGFSPHAELLAIFGYGYYPNTRTSIKFSATGGIDWQSVKTGEEPLVFLNEKYEMEELNWNLGANTVFQYYLSPSLRLNMNASISYDTNHSTTNMEYLVEGYPPTTKDQTINDKALQVSYSASVVYMIW